MTYVPKDYDRADTWESEDNYGHSLSVVAYPDDKEIDLTVDEEYASAQASLSPTTARALAAALIEAADLIDAEAEVARG